MPYVTLGTTRVCSRVTSVINIPSFTIEVANEESFFPWRVIRHTSCESAETGSCGLRTAHGSLGNYFITIGEAGQTNDRNLPESSERECAHLPTDSYGRISISADGGFYNCSRKPPVGLKMKLTSDTYQDTYFRGFRGFVTNCRGRLSLQSTSDGNLSSPWMLHAEIITRDFVRQLYWIIK